MGVEGEGVYPVISAHSRYMSQPFLIASDTDLSDYLSKKESGHISGLHISGREGIKPDSGMTESGLHRVSALSDLTPPPALLSSAH